MKYYAVTDDPNELLHYGRLGMKWGQHIFVGPKSLSYKKALGKLRTKSQAAKSSFPKGRSQRAINKARAREQKALNKEKKQQEKYNNAVLKAQHRMALTEGFNHVDQITSLENYAAKANRQERRLGRIEQKHARQYAKNDRKMDKYLQEAREGRLRYGKLSEEQVDRITNRLALEAGARRLGNTETPSFRYRRREAFKEGVLQGITQGTAAGMREVAVAKVQNRLLNKRKLDIQNRHEAQRQKEATRIKNKRTHREIRQDLKDEAYKESVAAGAGIFRRGSLTTAGAAKKLMKADELKKLNSQIQQDKLLFKGKNKELTKLGEQAQAAESRKNLLEYEQKRNNKIDEAWNDYVSDGGKKLFMDKDNRVYDLSSNSRFARENPEKLHDLRQKAIQNSDKRKEKETEDKEQKVYDKFVKEKQQEETFANQKKALEDFSKRYDREIKKIEENDEKYNADQMNTYQNKVEQVKKYNAEVDEAYKRDVEIYKKLGYPEDYAVKPQHKAMPKKPTPRITQKPTPEEYARKNPIIYEKAKEFPSYEEAKERRSIGLPSPLDTIKDKNKNQNQNRNKGPKK